MTSITTRAGKGSPLTHNEVDANFTNLNTDKLDTAGIALGSAASPTIKFTGDTNTGIYSPGSDQLAVSTGGTGRLFIDSSGRVGIGTSAPSGKLNILQDSTANTTPAIRITGSAGDPTNYFLDVVPIINGSTVDYRWDLKSISTNTALLYLSGAGNVGVGTSSPGANSALEVAGNQKYLSVITNAGGGGLVNPSHVVGLHFSWNRSNGNGESNIIYGTGGGSAPNLQFASWDGTTYTERLRIDSSGRLLVGTSSARISAGGGVPQMQLEGLGFAASSVSLTNNSNDSPGSYIFLTKTRGGSIGSNVIVQNNDVLGGLYFVGADGVDTQTAAAYIQGEVDGTPGADDMPGRLVFSTAADGSATPIERMRIDSSGNVGIGTTAPTTLLDVNADTVRVRTARTPASATATGDAGEICWDASYIYVCTATNTWKRAALSTW